MHAKGLQQIEMRTPFLCGKDFFLSYMSKCVCVRGRKMGLLHKLGYILEVAAFCSLIISKVWKTVENPGFVVTILFMIGSMYCLARAELPK